MPAAANEFSLQERLALVRKHRKLLTLFVASAMLSAIPVLLIPLIGYGLLRLQPLGEPGDSFRVLLTTM